jgi:thiol:disulfide interchange protein/DsbC/DsbD-like thiol-disulfide interchange protein
MNPWMHVWITRGLPLLAGVLLAGASLAQSVVITPQVRAELRVHAPQGLAAGQSVWLGLSLQHQPGWHTYWKNAGDSGLPTQLDWELPTGVTSGPVAWPLPTKLSVADLTNYGFEGKTLLGTPLTISPTFNPPAGTLDIKLKASWLVCRQECIPQEGQFRLSVPVRSSQGAHAAEFDALIQSQPARLGSQGMQAEVGTHALRLRISGWPEVWQGKAIELFPELNEVVESAAERHRQSRQSWQGGVWTAEWPLSALRSTEPRKFPLLMVANVGGTRQGLLAELPVRGQWPPLAPLTTPVPGPLSGALPSTAPQADAASLSTAPTATPLRQPLDDRGTDLTWWGALLGAFLGGLILNLMPCVLPVLAIKALHLARPDTPATARRQEGWGYAAGVMLSMLALGGTVMAIKAGGQQLGWGFQLQSPLVVSGLALLFTLIALNLWGWISLDRLMPASLGGLSSRHRGWDAFLAGVLAVAVATPCTAPFMGASIGLALGLPGWQGLSIFAALGAGLALPLLMIIHLPGLSHWLPRPGPWMITLRQGLGFPMLGTVVWLLWVLGLQVGVEGSSALLGLLLLLAAVLWAFQRPSRIAQSGALGLLLVWAALTGWTTSRLLDPTPAAVSSTPAAGWQAWSDARVREALQVGQPVFVDYTAAWCITCQVNKRTTLQQASVQDAFARQRVLLLQADWTRQDPAISASLAELGRSGVPVYVLHRPGQPPLVLPELLSPGTVLEALGTLKP